MSFDKLNLKKYSECNFRDISSQKIGIFIKGNNSTYVATSYIRLLSIFNSISFDETYFPCIIDQDETDNVIEDLDNECFLLDVIIIQRDVLEEDFSKKLIDYCKLFDIKIIFEIDDDLINIEKSHPEYEFYLEKSKIIKYIVKNSDEVVVSTEALGDKLVQFNTNINVIQNSLIDFWRGDVNKQSKNPDVIKIGYMGTVTHANDLMLVKKAIKNVKQSCSNQNIKIEFEMIGGTNEKWDDVNKIEIPNNKKEYPYFVNWLKSIVNWDIAIAPLEDTNLNTSKSLIKYLEYTALNVPGVFSPIGPYKKHIINYHNGVLVKDNSVNSWEESLMDLIIDESLRMNILKNSKKDVLDNFSMESAVNSWKHVLNRLFRNENSILNHKISQFRQNDVEGSFRDFLNSESRDIVIKSGLFDEEWYLNEYEDVKINNLDPINHFLKLGYFEGCKPSKNFNHNVYSENYSKKGLHPFIYYILYVHVVLAKEYENINSNIINLYEHNFNEYYLDNFAVSDIVESMNNVSIIIPIYNAYEDTKKCLISVFKNTNIPFNLILINDNSTDDRIKDLL